MTLAKGRGSVRLAGAVIRSFTGRFVNTFRGSRQRRDVERMRSRRSGVHLLLFGKAWERGRKVDIVCYIFAARIFSIDGQRKPDDAA